MCLCIPETEVMFAERPITYQVEVLSSCSLNAGNVAVQLFKVSPRCQTASAHLCLRVFPLPFFKVILTLNPGSQENANETLKVFQHFDTLLTRNSSSFFSTEIDI